MEQPMRMVTAIFVAVVLIVLAASVQSQTVVFNGIGSSAQFLQLGQAAGSATGASPAGLGAICVWSDSTGAFQATDPVNGETEVGRLWVAWTPGSPLGCRSIGPGTTIYAYLQTDSGVGVRCFFDHCMIGANSSSPTAIPTSNLLFPTREQVFLNPVVWAALSGATANVAGTDIRPEDAAFATLRAATACGSPVSGSNYLGLGYTSADKPIFSEYSGSRFHVTNYAFNATSSFSVTPLGAVPIVVFVNPSNPSGFGSGSFTNISRADLAKYLDGTYGSTNDGSTGISGRYPTTVLIQEPLSGAYNAVEYAVPNTTSRYTSQDVGLNQPSGQQNCTEGGQPLQNPLNFQSSDNASAHRNRVIGTSETLRVVFYLVSPLNISAPQMHDTLAYSFWSAANFGGATATNAKYLQVDGFDPLLDSYSTSNGEIPAASNMLLGDVTFNNLKNGNYPIWSMLRLVSTSPAPQAVTDIAHAAEEFVQGSTEPDFVPASALSIVHSHFTPPGITYPPSTTPNNGGNCGTEAGGDVGGVIFSAGSCATGLRM